MPGNTEVITVQVQALFSKWEDAEAYACSICDRVKDDYSQPKFAEADAKTRKLLQQILQLQPSLPGILAKLKVASYCEDYPRDANDPKSTIVAPRAVMAAIHDLESLIGEKAKRS